METITTNFNKLSNIESMSIQNVQSSLDNMVKNPIFYGLLSVLLTIYGPRLQPVLPPILRNLFNNNYFRFLIILLITFISSRNLQLALIVSIAFCLITSYTTSQEIKETFIEQFSENYSNFDTISNENTTEEFVTQVPVPTECINGVKDTTCVDYCLSSNGLSDTYCSQNFPSNIVNLDCSTVKQNDKVDCLNLSCDVTPNSKTIGYCKLEDQMESS